MTKNEFISTLAPIAVKLRLEKYVLFPSTRIAQNILETGSKIPTTNNLGGFKVGGGATNEFWRGLSTVQKTWEEYDGIRYDNVMAAFRVYVTIEDFYGDQNRLLLSTTRYKRVVEAIDPFVQADMLQACGYATDSKYGEKLKKIIKDNKLTKYDQEVYDPMKYKPTIIKERIRLVNGKLEYLPVTSRSVKATDVRFIKFERGRIQLKFIAEKKAKTSGLVIKHGADLGFNFPHHYADVPSGYVWANGKYINGAFGAMKEWYEWGVKGDQMQLGKFTNALRESFDFSVQADPPLILDGKMVWKNDGQACQRTFIGWDASGNFMLGIADGRVNKVGNYDIGLTCEEMAHYMRDKGAVWAFNGDGGGSTILADRTGGLNQASNRGVNERVNHHAVLVYYLDAPTTPTVPTPGYKDTDNITYGDLKKLGLIK